MKSFMVFAAVLAMAAADGYDSPQPSPQYGAPAQETRQAQVYRHVYVHSAPEEPVDRQSRVIRVPGNQDKHVNIIFVKTASNDFNQQTEVILPEQGEQKTLVYVLSKKGESTSDVKIRGPSPTQPSRPEVYFIRYKNEQQQQGGYPSAPAEVPAAQPVRTPSNSYGAPF